MGIIDWIYYNKETILFFAVCAFIIFGAVFSIVKHRKTSEKELGKRTAWLVFSIVFGILAVPIILIFVFIAGIVTGFIPIHMWSGLYEK